MSALLYKEIQTAGSPVFAYIGSGVSLIILVIFIILTKRLLYKILLGMLAVVVVPAILIFSHIKLETLYYTDKIDYRFSSLLPAFYQSIDKDSIARIEVVPTATSSAGIRTTDSGEVYKVRGNTAIQVTLKNGRTVGLGTHHAQEIKGTIYKYYPFAK